MLYLIPKPTSLECSDVAITKKTINLLTSFDDERLTKASQKLPIGADGIPAEFTIADDGEGYILSLTNEKLVVNAEGPAGAFYAIQTIRQLFTNEELTELQINDTPSFPHRGFYQDATRGKIAKIETFKALIDRMAYFKMNSLQLYVEHTFAFKEFASLADKTGCLTADEIRELDDYCYDNFIEFIPSIATFGHLYELLELPEYRDLCEIPNFEEKELHWYNRMRHHTIDPTNPRSIELIKSLINQYAPLFRTNKFNICCDETFDLKDGRHKDSGLDTGKLYVDFVMQIINHLQSMGKTVMMWADILLKHPETVDVLPKDVILLNWNYREHSKEDTVKLLASSGKTQILCPGTTTWSRFCENVQVETTNISNMAILAKKYACDGILNTNWGDYGNPCSLELAMYGMVLGAALSWNADDRADGEYKDSVNHLLYKNENGVNYLTQVDDICKAVDWWQFAHKYGEYICENKLWCFTPEPAKLQASQILAKAFIEKVSGETWEEDEYRQEMLLAAEGVAVMCEIWAKLLNVKMERFTSTSEWLEKYSAKWLQKNKPQELYRIQDMFNYLEGVQV